MAKQQPKAKGRTPLFANVNRVRVTLDCPLPEDLVDHIDALAADEGGTRTSVIRQAILEHFQWGGRKVGKRR